MGSHAGIHQQQSPVRQFDGIAGKTAVPVIGFVRRQGGREILPVEQVFAYRMAPMHRPPYRIVGMILVKHMVFPFIVTKAVGIIHPARAGGQVESRPVFGRDHLPESLLVFTCFAQCLAIHRYIPPYMFVISFHSLTEKHPACQ